MRRQSLERDHPHFEPGHRKRGEYLSGTISPDDQVMLLAVLG